MNHPPLRSQHAHSSTHNPEPMKNQQIQKNLEIPTPSNSLKIPQAAAPINPTNISFLAPTCIPKFSTKPPTSKPPPNRKEIQPKPKARPPALHYPELNCHQSIIKMPQAPRQALVIKVLPTQPHAIQLTPACIQIRNSHPQAKPKSPNPKLTTYTGNKSEGTH